MKRKWELRSGGGEAAKGGQKDGLAAIYGEQQRRRFEISIAGAAFYGRWAALLRERGEEKNLLV